MNELLDAQAGWTVTAALLAVAGMVWLLSTAFVASLLKAAREGHEDGSLREEWTRVDVTRSVSKR